jgi:outer membrane protein OmpA-like peptidoglycan-associated protein
MRLSFFLLFWCFTAFSQRDTIVKIYFNHGSYVPKSKVNPFLKIDTTRWNPVVTLTAKTDTTGDASYNHDLADFRLKAVKDLVAKQRYFKTGKTSILGETKADLANYQSEKERCVEVKLMAKRGGARPNPTATISGTANADEPAKVAVVMPRNFSPDSAMAKGDVFVMNNILFEINETILMPESYTELEQLLTVMQKNPEMRIHIKGHVCCAPAMDLSVKRAQKIYTYLVRNGISDKRLTFKGYSNKSPHPKYNKDLFDPRHRRVEIEILEK